MPCFRVSGQKERAENWLARRSSIAWKKIAAQIVMHAADCLGARGSLLVDENRGEKRAEIGKSKFETFLESGTNGAQHMSSSASQSDRPSI
jgi:hypothetical protein